MANNGRKLKIIALVCERSVDFSDKLDEAGCLKECPSVHVIKVPCSGHIQPAMIEGALSKGADGVIATGCRIGDCHYREGNKFLKERLQGTRQPKLKAKVDKKRIQAYWLSALEFSRFRQLADDFHRFLQAQTGVSQPDSDTVKSGTA